MAEYTNKNTFVLFLDEEKAGENHPDYTGKITLEDGSELRLAAWRRTSKDGTRKFLSGQVSEIRPKVAADF